MQREGEREGDREREPLSRIVESLTSFIYIIKQLF